MKQSTKLLSLVLALVMAFSCMTVIGNAALVKTEVTWDRIDDAQLTAEQVANLALDLVDNDLLSGIEPMTVPVIGDINLSSVNNVLASIVGIRRKAFLWGIASGLLGHIGKLDFDPLKKTGTWSTALVFDGSAEPWTREGDGDLKIIIKLLEFIGNDNNSDLLSDAAYGLSGGKGVNLGLIDTFLDLGEVGDMLNNIPLMLTELVYDLLIHGSYIADSELPKDTEEAKLYAENSFPSVEELKKAGKGLPTSVDTLNEIANRAIGALLTYPQDYSYEGEGEAAVKDWNEDSLVMPSIAALGISTVTDLFGITGSAKDWDGDGENDMNSLFQLIDKLAPFAIYDLGVGALNNNLKKTLMEAVEVEFDEIDPATLPADVKAHFEVDAVDGKESYVTYIAYDNIASFGSDWYYTTMENEVVMENGKPVIDEDGNEKTQKVRKYFKANTAGANDFYQLIDFGWEFVAPAPFKDTDGNGTNEEDEDKYSLDNLACLNYKALIAQYGSIMESLNHLLYVVFETAVKEEVKAHFEQATGSRWDDGPTTDMLMDNAERLLKYLLAYHADKIFGQSSPYVAWEYSEDAVKKEERTPVEGTVYVEDKSLLEIIAIIGPTFFEDVMPQLIMPKNPDGTYAFHEGVQVLEFGAIVIREFITEIAPNVNYDSYIFEEGTVTSANDRQFKAQDADAWFNIILNMGVDIGYTYLTNITNFEGTIPAQNITEQRWKDMLNEAIMWAANYVSNGTDGKDGTASVIHGFEPAKIRAYDDPLDRLSYILNTILPLGFICGCTSETFDFDVSIVFEKLKLLLTDFDLTEIATLFGRNEESKYNMFADENLVTVVLSLVNDIVNLVLPISENGDGVENLLQEEASRNLDTVISQANLKITVQQLLRAIYTQSTDLLNCALPVLGMFIKGWGTEQQYHTPQITLSKAIELTNGATTEDVTVKVRNASDGVWRHYRDANGDEYTDNQYQIQIVGVKVYDQFATEDNSQYVTITSYDTGKLDYGVTGTFKYKVTGVPASGALVRFEVAYKVFDEDGQSMSNDKTFYLKSFAWLNYNPTDEGTSVPVIEDGTGFYVGVKSPQYIDISNLETEIENIDGFYINKDKGDGKQQRVEKFKVTGGSADGITAASSNTISRFNNGDRNFDSVYPFMNKTYTCTSEDEDKRDLELTMSGASFNYDTWSGKGHIAASKTKAGSSTTIPINFVGTEKTSTVGISWSTSSNYNNTGNIVLKYYDGPYYNKLTSLATDEMDAVRLAADYNLTGTAYANDLLTTANSTDAEGETVFRDTNFKTTAWIATEDCGKWAGSYTKVNKNADGEVVSTEQITETVTEYAETLVEKRKTEKDEKGNVVSDTGIVTVDGKEIAVKKVTVIDCATAVGTKYAPAFVDGVQGGMQVFNANTVYDFEARYEALYVAANDIGYCKKSTEQVINEGNGDNIDGAVKTLKGSLDTIEAANSDTKDYTDYKMYRWNRFNDARDDAHYYVNLQNDAKNGSVTEIDETFPYTWIEEDDLRTLVSGDKYEIYITALLEKMDEEEIEAKAKWLEDKKLEYASQTLLDVEMATNLLARTSNRLLARDHGVITKYLDDEITSAKNMIGLTNNNVYTKRSWDKYIEAYNEALAVQAAPTQMTVFDAKYNLLTSRNELVKIEDEADYSELEALIAQAQMVMNNPGLYDNTPKEIGQVLAELGYKDFTNANGDDVQLFPGSALHENAEPYAVDEQYKIDRAATALKEALARLKFKGLNITGANIATETIVPEDKVNKTPAITASVARIAPEKDADAVKALLGVTADDAKVTTDLITVSNDVNYTIDTDLEDFTGTNATVTFYTLVSGVKVPVATVKVVVEADVNGDGTLDVLDGALTELTANKHAQLEGCYFIAANLDAASEEIVGADYSAVVNKILA